MEDSRTYPKGFFANLKSLFVERPPLYVPDVELNFFEASLDLFKKLDKWGQPLERHTCILGDRTPFPQHTTRCIWCKITGKWAKWQPSRRYTLSYNIYRPDGTLLSHQTEDKLELPSEYCNISVFTWRTFGHGWDEPGHWPTGVYQAELLIDGVRSATGHFTIAPPPPPKPPPTPTEVLQLPSVQFYASGRETIRFSQQTTREVICELTVRNLLYGKQGRDYLVTVQCSTVEGWLLWDDKRNWWITLQEQEPKTSWSIQMSGWSQGIYRVEIFIDRKEFAWGAFTIE